MNQLAFLRSIFYCYTEYPSHLHQLGVQPFSCKLDGSAMRPCDRDDGDGDMGRLFLVGFEEERLGFWGGSGANFRLGLKSLILADNRTR